MHHFLWLATHTQNNGIRILQNIPFPFWTLHPKLFWIFSNSNRWVQKFLQYFFIRENLPSLKICRNIFWYFKRHQNKMQSREHCLLILSALLYEKIFFKNSCLFTIMSLISECQYGILISMNNYILLLYIQFITVNILFFIKRKINFV